MYKSSHSINGHIVKNVYSQTVCHFCYPNSNDRIKVSVNCWRKSCKKDAQQDRRQWCRKFHPDPAWSHHQVAGAGWNGGTGLHNLLHWVGGSWKTRSVHRFVIFRRSNQLNLPTISIRNGDEDFNSKTMPSKCSLILVDQRTKSGVDFLAAAKMLMNKMPNLPTSLIIQADTPPPDIPSVGAPGPLQVRAGWQVHRRHLVSDEQGDTLSSLLSARSKTESRL